MRVSIDAQKTFDKIQQSFVIIKSQKNISKGNFTKLDNSICKISQLMWYEMVNE